MSTLRKLENLATGAAILAEWLGAGGEPVSQQEAEARAEVCRYCDQNHQAQWWEKAVTLAAVQIRQIIEVKNKLKVRTSNDQFLGNCQVCNCCNLLSVHAPIEFIAQHTTPEQLARFPKSCWKPHEIRGKRIC